MSEKGNLRSDPVNVGLSGRDYEVDKASGLYRLKKFDPGENWTFKVRSPLTEPE